MKLFALLFLFILAPVFLAGQVTDNVIASIDSISRLLDEQKDENRIQSLLAISEAYRLISFDKSLKTGLEASSESEKKGYHDLTAKIFRSLAFGARETGDYELSDEFFTKSLEAYTASGNVLQKAYIINNLALNQLERSYTDDALNKFHEALNIAQEYKDDTLRLLIHLNLGKIHYNKAEFNEAYDDLQTASTIATKLKDDHNHSKAQQNLAMIHWQWDENNLALSMLRETIPVFEKHQNDESLSMIFNNIGLIFLHDKQLPDSAFRYFHMAKKIREDKGWQVALANVLVNMAVAHTSLQNLKEAIDLLHKALDIYTKSGVNEGIVRTHFQLGETYHKQQQYMLSNWHLNQSLKLGEPFGIEQYNMAIYELMMINFYLLNDFDNYIQAYTSFKNGHDNMVTQLNQLQSAEANWKVENAALVAHIEKQNIQLLQSQQQVRKQQILLGAIGATILVLIFSTILFFISRKSNSKQNSKQSAQILTD